MPGHASVKAIAFAARTYPGSGSVSSGGRKGAIGQRADWDGKGDGDEGREGIMIAAGGRLTYSIWEYSLNNIDTEMDLHLESNGTDLRSAKSSLSSLTSGTVAQKMNQDHRILCVQCVNISATRTSACEKNDDSCSSRSGSSGRMREDVYLITLGDSRGKVTIATYIHKHFSKGT